MKIIETFIVLNEHYSNLYCKIHLTKDNSWFKELNNGSVIFITRSDAQKLLDTMKVRFS